ncbi:DNA polymerase III subunit gamma/tau [Shewanella intestini]|uniref:DNA-directed DNA polymerase n=1 Tax=Shewanella intestini TaxID=2017544 RepID=A0ABS5I4M1_9GAMM|nr:MULTISPECIES: DNA polymerase III subunit gamma/tau [Shewanella]MBR9728966.1 DNA polymerase III subunit gamma/tau [Shewanella intestini]MRG36968.1 DNA polymerase III subunit gamma/tau [Shewanella sp. XMDDZSB0408]
MSYQVLARKWRPATFEQMVGQSHVLLALTNALTQQRLHHAYLFTGTRGVGKTSLARLFAKGLNCEQGVSASPCGKCASCVEIAQGRFVDLIEVDAASRTKVDDTRELLDNVQYRPTRGRYKVYLIDEVHMLSRSSFNALLKTLEEPPEHVKFLLATTDPQKLPVTVLSRCLQFNLKSLTQTEISQQLDFVLNQEQISFETPALNLLAKAANGSMRDALSLTDQAIAFSSGQVSLEQVQSMLGSIDEQHVIALLNALCDAEVGPLLQCVNRILAFGAEADEVLRSLLELLHQITLTQFAPAAAQQSLFAEQILAFAKQVSAEQIQLYYQLLLNGRKDLPHAPDPKSGLEMALLRAVAFVPEKVTQRWVVDTAANVDINAKYSQQQPEQAPPPQEVIDTGPKPSKSVAETRSQPTLNETSQHLLSVRASAVDANKQAKKPEQHAAQETQDESLAAEQAMLLSQAQSLGFEEQVVNQAFSKDVPKEETLPQVDDLIADTENASKLAVTSSVSVNKQPHIAADANVQALTFGVTDNIEAQSQTSDFTLETSTKSDDVNTQTVNEDAYYMAMADMASQSSFDAENYVPYQRDEAITAPFDNPSAPGENFAEQPAAENESPVVESTLAQSSLAQSSKEQIIEDNGSDLSQANEHLQNNQLSEDFDDDLDAVLACRDSLMADIDALNLEDNAAKEADTKTVELKKPAIKPADASNDIKPNINPDVDASIVDEPHQHQSSLTTNKVINAQLGAKKAQSEMSNELESPQTQTGQADDDGRMATMSANEAQAEQYVDENDRPPWVKPIAPLADAQQAIEHESDISVLKQTDEANPVSDVQATTESSVDQLQALGHEITGDSTDLQWYRVMSQVKVGGRVRQLGVNSVCDSVTSPLKLTLKPNQKHLAAPVAIEQLQAALFDYFETEMQVEIEIGLNRQHETPLEMRKRFHQELTSQATHSLMSDANVQWLTNRLSAELNQDSVVYPAEKLAQVANLIPVLDN